MAWVSNLNLQSRWADDEKVNTKVSHNDHWVMWQGTCDFGEHHDFESKSSHFKSNDFKSLTHGVRLQLGPPASDSKSLVLKWYKLRCHDLQTRLFGEYNYSETLGKHLVLDRLHKRSRFVIFVVYFTKK